MRLVLSKPHRLAGRGRVDHDIEIVSLEQREQHRPDPTPCCMALEIQLSRIIIRAEDLVPEGRDITRQALIGGQLNDPTMPLEDIVYSDVVPSNKVTNWGGSGQIDYEFGGVTLTSISAYRDTTLDADQDVDFSSSTSSMI